MKSILLFLLCAAPSAFGAQIYFYNDTGKASVETKFDRYGGGVRYLKESQSGSVTSGSPIHASQTTGYRMANPDGTEYNNTFSTYNRALLMSGFNLGVLYADGEAKSEQWGDGLDYPRDYKPLVTDTNVAAAVSLHWDFLVTDGDVTINAKVLSNGHRDSSTQYVRLSGPSGSIFNLSSFSSLDGYGALPEPLTLTPGRYSLRASSVAINEDDDYWNWFQVQISGVDGFTHREVPDGGTSLVLFSGSLLGLAALCCERAGWTSRPR